MSPRVRALGGLAAIAVAAAAFVFGARYEIVQAIDDRLGSAYSLGSAEFDPPGPIQWPRLTQDEVLAICDLCANPRLVTAQITTEYGLLVSDDALNDLSNVGPNRPPSGADVPLPRMVWILQWHPTCNEAAPAHSERCATYELVDDATGWLLDSGQVLTP